MLWNLIGGRVRLIPVLDNLNRIRILELCKKEPYKYNIRGLARELNVGVKSIFHHVKLLKKEGLIKTKKATCKGGYKTLIATNTQHYLIKDSLPKIEKENPILKDLIKAGFRKT